MNKIHFNWIYSQTCLWAVSIIIGLVTACKGPEGGVGPAGTTGPQGPQGAQGPVGPNLTGSLVGFARLRDAFNAEKPSHAGVLVSLKGTSPLISDTTDVNGYFELKNVKTGSYNLELTKANYTPYTFAYVQHIGGSSANIVNVPNGAFQLYERPNYAVKALTLSSSTTAGATVRVETDAALANQNKGIAFYWSTDPAVTFATRQGLYYQRTLFRGNTQDSFLTFSPGFSNSLGGTSGQKLYVYAIPYVSGASTNPLTNLLAGTNLFSSTSTGPVIITIP